ncbi:MAG: hypothetical protein MI810_10250 [Flavobacteriales bacterium]|nr:hypothetical protein [Flavobacteriales bacterium]
MKNRKLELMSGVVQIVCSLIWAAVILGADYFLHDSEQFETVMYLLSLGAAINIIGLSAIFATMLPKS